MGPGFLRKNADLVGFSVASEAGDSWYFPIAHAQGENYHNPAEAVAWFKDLCASKTAKVGHNILYDVEALDSQGIELKGAWHDTMVYDALINENETRYTLDAVGERRCGVKKDETLLEDAAFALGFKDNVKGNLWQIPPEYVGPYAEQDAAMLIDIFKEQYKIIDNNHLRQVMRLESKLLKVIWAMRKQGVRVDIEQALILKNQWTQELEQLLSGMPSGLDIWSAESLADYCNNNSIPYNLTDAGNPSFEHSYLSGHSDGTLRACSRARKLEKMCRDFITGSVLRYAIDGRIHAQFHTTRRDDYGTRSGRFSSSNPNLQQIPARDPEFGPRLRELYLPDHGFEWGKFDYSSQEPRITLHLALIHSIVGTEELRKEYQRNASFDIHNLAASLVSTDRFTAKTVGLGITYGMGSDKLSRQLGCSLDEAKILKKEYNLKVPFIKKIFDEYVTQAEEKGFVSTVLGRRAHISGGDTYKALNRAVQGTGADMIKVAMVKIYEELGLAPLLTVHDEVNYNVVDEEVSWQIAEIMENALPLQIPALVEPELKSNWNA